MNSTPVDSDLELEDLWPWRRSTKGNLTRVFRGARMTVCADKHELGYRYCISVNGEPYFSGESYETVSEAQTAYSFTGRGCSWPRGVQAHGYRFLIWSKWSKRKVSEAMIVCWLSISL
jgi:hypothetical protein